MGKSPASKTALVVPYKFAPPVNGGHKAAYGFAEFLSQELDFVCISSHNNANEDLPFSLIKCFKDKIFKYISPFVAWKIRKNLNTRKGFLPYSLPALHGYFAYSCRSFYWP